MDATRDDVKIPTELVAFEVEEAFQITGRGAALVTSADLSMLRPGHIYSIRFTAPDGTTRVAAATMEMLLRRQPQLVEKYAMLAKEQRTETFPPGTIISVFLDPAP